MLAELLVAVEVDGVTTFAEIVLPTRLIETPPLHNGVGQK